MARKIDNFARRACVAFTAFALLVGTVPCVPARAAGTAGENAVPAATGEVVKMGTIAKAGAGGTGTMSARAARGKTVRILFVGNSWAMRSAKYLGSIARSAGKKVVVGRVSLKRGSLQELYFGLLNGGGTFRYGGTLHRVRTRCVYRKRTVRGRNAKKRCVTLGRAIKDEPWDYLVLQNRAPESGNYAAWDKREPRNEDVLYRHGSRGGTTSVHFDVNDFVDLVKAKMRPAVARRLKVGLSAVWSYPQGQAGGVADSIHEYLRGRGLRAPSTQAQWNAVYRRLGHDIQRTIPKVAAHMGRRCDFIVNPGRAFAYAREDAGLSRFGYHLSVSKTNAHPATGLPCYIAGLTYAFGILGIGWDDLKGYRRAGTKSYGPRTRAGLGGRKRKPTPQLALRAVACAWQAQKGTKVRIGEFSVAPLFGRGDVADKRHSPSLRVKGPNFGTLQRGVDFKVTRREVDANGNSLRITCRGVGRFRGEVTRTFGLRPGKVQLTGALGKRGAVRVSWRAPGSAEATGVQVRLVSTKTGKVAKKVTVRSCTRGTRTIARLKGGEGRAFKVQARAYRTVEGKRYAGPWSDAEVVQVAKGREGK